MIRVKKLNSTALLPTRQHWADAGADLYVPTNAEPLYIGPGEVVSVGTGISVSIPPGQVGLVHPRSGLAANYGITVLNAPGTIDSGYTGEVRVVLINHSQSPFRVDPGSRIAQLVIQQVLTPMFVEGDPDFSVVEATRGPGGFGSTGL